MEKRRLHPQSILVLMLMMLCAVSSALGQDKRHEATVTTDDNQASVATMRAAALVPMAARPGDVNVDGLINISDVTDLIDVLLSGSVARASADVNLDGLVNISDVTDLIDMLLNGTSNYHYGKGLYDLNEIYRSMRTAGWTTTGNTHQCFGISAYSLAAEVMGDDMIMGDQGSGWFWFDAAYNVKSRYTSNSWRSYDLWTAYYTWIANANYILTASGSMTGTASEKSYIMGQAYAIRAYSYFMLAQWFARTYKGHESDPCVPLFNGVEFNGSTGQPRATVAQVYAQIDADINQAVSLLRGTTQMIPDHIGYAVALGLRARIALVKEDWITAYNSAVAAINASGKSILPVGDFMGLNDAYAGNVMWGGDIPVDQVGMYASFFSHMSTSIAYGSRAPKQITTWLYDKMSPTDTRRAWWDPNDEVYSTGGYIQKKFDFSNLQTWEGDYIYMRVEEMYLTVAEAACRRGKTTNAKNYLNQLMAKRDTNYTCNKTGTSLGTLTNDETGSLLEEILIQRRLELWGEDGRIYTIRRLRQGFKRTSNNGWPAGLLLPTHAAAVADAESYAWVMTIPQSEFYNDIAVLIDPNDQNPIGDYPDGTPQDLERNPQHISFVNASQVYEISPRESLTITIPMTREIVSDKPYYALIKYNNLFCYAYFAPNKRQGSATIDYSRYYPIHETLNVSLTRAEREVATSSQRTTMTIDITVRNKDPQGQHISFETAYQEVTTDNSYIYDVPITLTRADPTNAYVAQLYLSENGGQEYSEWVYFAPGVDTVSIYKSFYGLAEGMNDTLVCRLSEADIATVYPDLWPQITTMTLIAKYKNDWKDLGTGVYNSPEWWEEEFNVPIQQNKENPNEYRMVGLFQNGYDIRFIIEGDKVYVAAQPSWHHSTYGDIYLVGDANGTADGYAGTYDAATKTVTFNLYHYVPGVGGFGTFVDTLTMP